MRPLLMLIFLITFFCSYSNAKDSIVIGSKNFSESLILSEIVGVLLETNYNQTVVRKLGLGGTKIAFDALMEGGIDTYPDYTGTGYSMILKMNGENDPEKVYNIVREEFESRWGIIWSDSIGFNNTYALAVSNSDERFKGIKNISELSGGVESFRYGAAYEFMEREDGHGPFAKAYNLNFSPNNIISMEAGLMYSAIRDKQVDMIVAYSTDGRIKAYDLRILRDDNNFFPPYYVSFLAKKKTLKKFPALQEVFKIVGGLVTEDEIVEMNDQVDRLKRGPRNVARNFLIEKGLIKGKLKKRDSNEGFLSYMIYKKDYLFKIIIEHLALSFFALFFAVCVSIPTGILLTRYQKLGKFIFPIVNTIQTIPSLALLGFLIPVMGIGFAPALLALFLYSLLPLIRNTYTGIMGVEQNYIEASRGTGLTNLQILLHVELPLALPIIIAGLRTAAVIVIGTATLAALIGAGGLGDPIFRGVSTVNSNLILLGAIPAALLAIIVDKLIGVFEKVLVSKGLRLKR